MADAQRTNSGPEVIGIEVWTGVGPSLHTHPTRYFRRDEPDIVEMGQDGYPGGTFWIRFKNGETHAYTESAVRRVVLK